MFDLRPTVTALLHSHLGQEKEKSLASMRGYPSKKAVLGIMHDLYALLVPQSEDEQALERMLLETCERINLHLTQEIAKSLNSDHAKATAERICRSLLDALPKIHALLKTDAEAAYRGDPAAKGIAEIHLSYPGFRAIVIHRVAHFLYQQKLPLIPRMMSEIVHSETGIDIHPGATIGESFFIDHGTGVVIGETTLIGPRVKLYQGVTLGALSVHDRASGASERRHPTIEEDVTIYAGATILGGHTTIGKGSVIGGNVWLTQSVPPHTKILNKAPYLIYEDLKTGKEIKREESLDLKI